ncbi:MAG: hypothetical protein ACKPKO_07035, partial [Candidatus Fonsibacter sp.]
KIKVPRNNGETFLAGLYFLSTSLHEFGPLVHITSKKVDAPNIYGTVVANKMKNGNPTVFDDFKRDRVEFWEKSVRASIAIPPPAFVLGVIRVPCSVGTMGPEGPSVRGDSNG